MESIPLPNPFTPLVFLPPTLASQLEILTYLGVVCLGISMHTTGVGFDSD
jgi:hypothetical protein